MKMTKKLFLVAIATAAFALTSCEGLLAGLDTKNGTGGDGKTTGFKWNKKMTVDGNDKDLYDKDGNVLENAYRRFIKKIKANETVTNISTDIVIDLKNSVLQAEDPKEGQGKAVVGLAFDFHTSADKTKYDFVLVGFAPERGDNGSFYIERYFDIPTAMAKTAADAMAEVSEITGEGDDTDDLGNSGFDSSDVAMGHYYTFRDADNDGIYTITDEKDGSDWLELPAGALVKDEKTATINVRVEQTTAGLYEIFVANKKVATYEGEVKIAADAKKNPGFAQGGVAVYANTPVGKTKGKGTKVVVTYKSDKKLTNGLFEEVDE